MTTQSPDQSNSQSPTGTEAEVCADIAARQAKGIAKYGVSVADNPLALREWLQHAYEETLDNAVYLKRAISAQPSTQSPAPSKEMEERIQDFVNWIYHTNNYPSGESVIERLRKFAAELGKEREAEDAGLIRQIKLRNEEIETLRAELADRWRDITANEQQTQRLLNDIENLRAEIAELKARP